MKTTILSYVFAAAIVPGETLPFETLAEFNLDNVTTSNIFMDASREWDHIVRPNTQLGLDFGDYWSAGYNGEINFYTQHQQLLSNWHEFYLFANPAWGEKGQNELTCELRTQMLFNSDTYEAINLVHPAFLGKFVFQPVSWWRWRLAADLSYRWFFEDHTSDAVDLWLTGRTSFSLPSATNLSTRLGFGLRYFPHPAAASVPAGAIDNRDQQLEAGLGASQYLWSGAGLHFDVVYLKTFGTSVQLLKKLAQEQFIYLGDEFLFSGLRSRAAIRQLLGTGWTIELAWTYERRRYEGWSALDGNSALLGEDREDRRLAPSGSVRYAWAPRSEKRKGRIEAAGLALEFTYLYQNSNSAWYDTATYYLSLSTSVEF